MDKRKDSRKDLWKRLQRTYDKVKWEHLLREFLKYRNN